MLIQRQVISLTWLLNLRTLLRENIIHGTKAHANNLLFQRLLCIFVGNFGNTMAYMDSVQGWLSEIRLMTETECMSVLQGKSLSQDLQQSSTTLIKCQQTNNLCILPTPGLLLLLQQGLCYRHTTLILKYIYANNINTAVIKTKKRLKERILWQSLYTEFTVNIKSA